MMFFCFFCQKDLDDEGFCCNFAALKYYNNKILIMTMKLKLLSLFVALMCVTVFKANAQNNSEQLQKAAMKVAEERMKDADKNPKNGKKQLVAADAFIVDDLGDKRDLDRAMVYVNKALKIAEAQPVLKDTLMGTTCCALGSLYYMKGDLEKSVDYFEKGLGAIEQEFGRYDPITIFNKLRFGYLVMCAMDVRRGSLFIQQAFLDSEKAPAEKRLKNLENLTAVYEMAIDFLVADITMRMQRGLPLVTFEGKKYYILETPEWNMEQPIVGWLTPKMLPETMRKQGNSDGAIILMDDQNPTADLRVIDPDAESRPEYEVGFSLDEDGRTVVVPDDHARLMFFPENIFNQVLAKYRAFKARQ